MLKAHLDAVETQLIATSKIPANAGHPLHRGTPREAFVREFLEGHISTRVSIGTGEVIDASSPPRQPRNQFDIVVCRNDYPRLNFGGGISAFLAESVLVTIEVKSLLTAEELEKAVLSARNVKRLRRNVSSTLTSGYIPPGILSYVVAYAGPAQLTTVYHWLKTIEKKHNLNSQNLPPTLDERTRVLSESVDGVFCLGLGSVVFDNVPITVITDAIRQANPDGKYALHDTPRGNIMRLFLFLTQAVSGVSLQVPNLLPYLSGVRAQPQLVP